MRKRISRRHEAQVRVQNVCAEHSAFFDATPAGAKTRAILGTHVEEVTRLLALQERSHEDRRAATAQVRAARRALRADIMAVVTIGRGVNLDAAMMGAMRFPGGATDDELLAYGRGLLDRVSPHADAFVAAGLPPDLLTHLAGEVAAFDAARDAQAAARQRFTAATESIRETLDEADQPVDVLETIARTTPGAPSEVLTKLRIARRIGPRVVITPAPVPPQPAPKDKAA
jgi:hypothetical protein